jgi:RNA polymerase sigma factor (sigma-70 family)
MSHFVQKLDLLKKIHSGLQGARMVRLDWSDEDLARRLHERDPEALETLISRYSREVFCFIRVILDGVGVTQDAEECVNDLFVAVWQEIDMFDAMRGTLRTWLTMRAKYIALDRRRQLCRRQTHNVQSADEMTHWYQAENNGNRSSSGWDYDLGRAILLSHPEASMENLLEQSERREELCRALVTLPELDRFLIYQRYFKFASAEELAAKTGLTRHAVDTRLWRARKSLRDALKEHSCQESLYK